MTERKKNYGRNKMRTGLNEISAKDFGYICNVRKWYVNHRFNNTETCVLDF